MLRNLGKAFRFNDRNTEVFMKLREGKDPSKPDPNAEPDDMRIDSDDIHNHYHQQKEGMSSLAKLVAIGLASTGIGIPASIAAFQLPEILEMFAGSKPAAAVQPAETPKSDVPTVTIGGQEYQLELGEPDQQ